MNISTKQARKRAGHNIKKRMDELGMTMEQKVAVKKLLHFLNHKMDWERFWARVAAKSAPEIEAYRRARRSYIRHPHAFI
jgi:DNA mismatch repair ATPase MutS